MKLIPLTQGQFAKVDDEVYEFLIKWKWQSNVDRYGNFYAIRTGLKADGHLRFKPLFMHNIISGANHKEVTDHIDHDTLNNTSSNLRACTISENARNQKISKNNTSGYKGVMWCKRSKKWLVRISVDNKRISLRYHSCKHEAARVYNLASKMYHGEFGRLNIIVD